MNRLNTEFKPVMVIWRDWASQFLKLFSAKIEDFGKLLIFCFEVLRKVGKRPFRRTDIFRQLEFIGNHSFGVILLTGFLWAWCLVFKWEAFLRSLRPKR